MGGEDMVEDILVDGGDTEKDSSRKIFDMKPAQRKRPDISKSPNNNVELEEESLIVYPGDDVTTYVSSKLRKIKLGRGLMQRNNHVFATRAGLLSTMPPDVFYVESNQRRYIPQVEDHVLGIVEGRLHHNYKVNINGPSYALLPHEAFDGASKRNKPNLKDGALVYCRVVCSDKDMEPELSCIAAGNAVKKDWMTHQGTFGELVGGMNARCSLRQARKLMDPTCAVLNALGKEFRFEVAVGENGHYWVNSEGGAASTTVIINAIMNAEFFPAEQHASIVKHCVSTMRLKFA